MKKIILSTFVFFITASGLFAEAKYRYELTICAMFKDEARWLKEWLVYHHNVLGFDHFYLYNNDSTDNYIEVLQPFIEEGIVELIDWNSADPAHRSGNDPSFIPYQIGAYNDCMKNKALGYAKWVAIIDIDEFIVPVHGAASFHSYMRRLEKHRVGTVRFHWRVFGTSDIWDLQSKELLTEKLIFRAADNYGWNGLVKSMYRPEAVFLCSVHEASGYNPHYRIENAKPERVRLHHYWTRTEAACYEKRNIKKTESQGFLDELNQIEDRTMEQYLPTLKSALQML
jgi:hypothetical protein